jgi:hypothetical protein
LTPPPKSADVEGDAFIIPYHRKAKSREHRLYVYASIIVFSGSEKKEQ